MFKIDIWIKVNASVSLVHLKILNQKNASLAIRNVRVAPALIVAIAVNLIDKVPPIVLALKELLMILNKRFVQVVITNAKAVNFSHIIARFVPTVIER